jgi:hypothetical protein
LIEGGVWLLHMLPPPHLPPLLMLLLFMQNMAHPVHRCEERTVPVQPLDVSGDG